MTPFSAPPRDRLRPVLLLFVGLCLGSALPASAQVNCQQGVCLDVLETDAAVSFVANNERYFDVSLSLRLTHLDNLEPSLAPPLVCLVPPRTRLPVLALRQIDQAAERGYRYEWDLDLGNPDAHHAASVRYALPFEASTPRLLLQGIGGAFSHTGPYFYSFDFKMPVGTLVLVAREGVVARVIDGFTQGGPSPALADRANLVTIRHTDGTYGEYVHLAPGSALVREGDSVPVGHPVARSGNTGFTSEPHLHFMVWKTTREGKFETLSVHFDDGSAEGYVPREDLWYGSASIQQAAPSTARRKQAGNQDP